MAGLLIFTTYGSEGSMGDLLSLEYVESTKLFSLLRKLMNWIT